MSRHLDTLAAAFTFYGALVFAITTVVGGVMLALGLALGSWEPAALSLLLPVIGITFAVPFIWTGYGIRGRRPSFSPQARTPS